MFSIVTIIPNKLNFINKLFMHFLIIKKETPTYCYNNEYIRVSIYKNCKCYGVIITRLRYFVNAFSMMISIFQYFIIIYISLGIIFMQKEEIMTDKEITKRITELMSQKGLNANKLAQLSDIAPSTLNSMLDRGNTPTLPTLVKICNGLGITITQFFMSDTDQQVTLTKDQKFLIETFNGLTHSSQMLLLKIAEDFLSHQEDSL